ncbi:MAG: helicase-related protein, partial [Rhodospirillales bacterium]|nr:helicase-related protein [Rhodospirillales bacterium]
RRTLVFAVSRRHGRLLSASLSQAGARAAFLDGTAIGAERRTTLDAFREGHVNTLVTVDLLIEGFDVPAANCAILARPTKSVVIHLQQCGRVLRRSPDGLDALILDCVGNTSELGGPASPRGWTLFGGAQKTKVQGDGRTTFEQGWGRPPPTEADIELVNVGRGDGAPDPKDDWRATVNKVRNSIERATQGSTSPNVQRMLDRLRG